MKIGKKPMHGTSICPLLFSFLRYYFTNAPAQGNKGKNYSLILCIQFHREPRVAKQHQTIQGAQIMYVGHEGIYLGMLKENDNMIVRLWFVSI